MSHWFTANDMVHKSEMRTRVKNMARASSKTKGNLSTQSVVFKTLERSWNLN